MKNLHQIISYASELVNLDKIKDFPPAKNGLQFENSGTVKKIASCVDSSLENFKKAKEQGANLVFVHHGLFWKNENSAHIKGAIYEKYKFLIDNDIAVFSCHLPLDGDPIFGNNALIAKELNYKSVSTFINYEGMDIGVVVKSPIGGKKQILEDLKRLFPNVIAIEKGSEPEKIGICSGSGASVYEDLPSFGLNTLITGELKEAAYAYAEDYKLNLYACGHYATETFGIDALGKFVAQKFGIDYSFIDSSCPL